MNTLHREAGRAETVLEPGHYFDGYGRQVSVSTCGPSGAIVIHENGEMEQIDRYRLSDFRPCADSGLPFA